MTSVQYFPSNTDYALSGITQGKNFVYLLILMVGAYSKYISHITAHIYIRSYLQQINIATIIKQEWMRTGFIIHSEPVCNM